MNYTERKHVASYVILVPLPQNEQPLHVCFNIAAIGSRPPNPAIAANNFPASDQALFATDLRKVASSIYWCGETAAPVYRWLLLRMRFAQHFTEEYVLERSMENFAVLIS